MSGREPLVLDSRRQREFARELVARASAWLPDWSGDESPDFARALLEIAARFAAEVTERLDKVPEKMRRGFFDWLGVRGDAARPARMPVVFQLASRATRPSLAPSGTQLQVEAAGANVVFETEADVNLQPARLAAVIAADADNDQYFVQPQRLTEIEPGEALPDQWVVRGEAAVGADKLQLDPDTGLTAGTLLAIGGHYYEIAAENKGLVTISPAVRDANVADGAFAVRVTAFSPFDREWLGRQEHALYLGDAELLNLEAAATIDVVGGKSLPAGIGWEYWGKVGDADPVGWQPLTPAPAPVLPTDPPLPTDALRFTKPKGSLESLDLGTVKGARWIRAVTPQVSAAPDPAERFALRINPVDVAPDPATSPAADALANTSPLSLNAQFYPLGREPRLFDAFYLGCPEVFSKHGAAVRLNLDVADPTAPVYAAIQLAGAMRLASIGKDRALHLHTFNDGDGSVTAYSGRESLQPALPGWFGIVAPQPGPFPLSRMTGRPPVWIDGAFFAVAVAAGKNVWVWVEWLLDSRLSGWFDFGTAPGDAADPDAPIDSLALLDDGAGNRQILARRDGVVSTRPVAFGVAWTAFDKVTTVALRSVCGVLDPTTLRWTGSATRIAMGDDGVLYSVAANGVAILFSAPGAQFDSTVTPIALDDPAGVQVIAVRTDGPTPQLVYHSSGAERSKSLELGATVEPVLELVQGTGNLPTVLASVHAPGRDYVASWTPTAAAPLDQLFKSGVTSPIAGGPTHVGQWVIVPGPRGDSLVARLDFGERRNQTSSVGAGVVIPDATPALIPGDFISADESGAATTLTDSARTWRGLRLQPLPPTAAPQRDTPTLFRAADVVAGGSLKAGAAGDLELTLASDDPAIVHDLLLLVRGFVYRVSQVDPVSPFVAHLVEPNWATGPYPPAPGAPTMVNYFLPVATSARSARVVELALPSTSDWSPERVEQSLLYFAAEVTRARVFGIDVFGHPNLVELVPYGAGNLPALSPAVVTFILDGALGEWEHRLSESPSNPALSWEYWNGSSWATLDLTRDETLNLKSAGEIRFIIPLDLREGEWAGKTSFWIRARLVGGDYGHEEVTTHSRTLSDGSVETTSQRSTTGIRPPLVLSLGVGYSIANEVLPSHLLTQDSGTLRDQSDANRASGVIVESFVPLSKSLARVSGGGSGRSIFLGFDGPIAGDSVNVLFLVPREAKQDASAPLTVQAFVVDRFAPVTAQDATRALGETGLLTLAFPEAPTEATLFGQTLRWVRLSPHGSGWSPTVRAAFVNAAWASATETLTRELLGSSEGEPDMTVRVARPPLLHHSLELRVRELLGEDERTDLKREPGRVLSDDTQLPGDWVLWEQVVDPADAEPTARVYALDETTGVIRFGDGKHGAIPTTGRDSIIAFTYKRTEPPALGALDVPANSVESRAQLNLVTPVESVEAVYSAEHAAGGSPPEPDERVLRFGAAKLRHRGRAVTLRDLEDLALASSPEIAQARALVRGSHVELVVVMAGDEPAPSETQKRELERRLRAAAPVSLAGESLAVVPPVLRWLRIALTIRVESLDGAAAVRRAVEQRLRGWLDAARGGRTGEGWPLGASPTENDIARALLDVPGLLALEDPELVELRGRGARPWPESLQPGELARLAADGVRIDFELAERAA